SRDEFATVFRMLVQGTAIGVILGEIELRYHDDATFARRLAERAKVFRGHLSGDSPIPEMDLSVRMRELGRAVLPRLDQIMVRLEPGFSTDPVCKKALLRRMIALEHNGEAYYFCSPTCKTTFDADPAKYLD